jgi:hypothetical protein
LLGNRLILFGGFGSFGGTILRFKLKVDFARKWFFVGLSVKNVFDLVATS